MSLQRHYYCDVLGVIILLAVFGAVTPSLALASDLSFPVDLRPAQIQLRDEGGAVEVRLAGENPFILREAGYPELPYKVVNVVLPQGEKVESFHFIDGPVSVLAANVDVKLAAGDDSPAAVAPPIARLAEGKDGAFPFGRGKYLGTGYLHGYAIASFAVFPLRVSEGDLLLTERVLVEVTTTRDIRTDHIVTRERYVEGFRKNVRQSLESFTVNASEALGYQFSELHVPKKAGGFQPTSFPSLEGSPVEYVIITNDSLAGAYEQLAGWKTAKGVPTVIRTTEWIEANYRNGVDVQETIRDFVKDAYAKWGITYVLLGGDSQQIPVRYGASFYSGEKELPADMYYACLDGDWNADHDQYFGEGGETDQTDLYAEIYVGRLPTGCVADVNLLTQKIVEYETSTDFDYTRKVLFMAEVLFPIGWQEPDPIAMNGATYADDIFNDHMTDPDLFVTRMYETEYLFPGAVHESKAAALDSINTGYNHVIHIGHGFRFNISVGDASIVNSDVDVLVNGTRYSNAYLLNCTALAFTYFCLAEHMLLAPGGGAVSAIGANESAFPFQSNQFMYEYYRLLFDRDVVHLGKTFADSRLPFTALAGLYDNSYLWTCYIYTLLGDPEMCMWTDVVDTLQVSHPADVNQGTTSIQVTVGVGGVPEDSVMVCLSKGTDDYQYGLTDPSGQVTFDFRAESAGDIRVVTTGLNHSRYEGTITVNASSGAYVSLNGMTVDDDSTGGTYGNGDGVIDAGEIVDLTLEMVNSGGTASGTVSLILRSEDLNVVITDSLASVGVVPGSGGTQVASDAVRVEFSPDLSDEAAVDFTLVVKENGFDTWADAFSRTVHAPILDLVKLRIDDSALGNGNGIAEDYEEFDLYYEIKNYGTGTAYGLTAELADLEDGFIFTDSTDVYPPLPPVTGSENVNGFFIEEPHVLEEHDLEITITDAYGRAYVDTIELRPPSPPVNVISDPKLGPDRLLITWEANGSPDVVRYNVYESGTQGGPYYKISLDPVEHTIFLSSGLCASCRYYYVVTSLDESGNESAYSVEYTGSTNPEQVEGWPIRMSWETTSSPVIGDIDGDGDLEIVQGNQNIYAWHHDGVELADGDGNAQTWGLLTTSGEQFVSPVALAAIDGQAGLDIIAASRDTKEIYVFDYNGNTVAGWPRPLENYIRAGLAVGDINDDSLLEIVTVDERGVMYVWNRDGSEYRDGDSNPSTPGVFDRLSGCTLNYSTPAIADIDGDLVNEIIVGTQGDSLYVYDEDGTILPGWPYYLGADVAGSPAVGDIDDDGDLEIVVNTSGGSIMALHHDGTILWSRWFANGLFFGPSPALGDVTGDGKLETACPSSNGKLFLINYTGSNLPNWPVRYSDYTYTESSPLITDLDGDGSPDVLIGDESPYLKAWDVGGNMIAGFPLATGDAMRAVPAADDIDFDGDVDLIAAGWDQTIYVWDFQEPYDVDNSPWPNFHGNRHNDGLLGSILPTGIVGVSFTYEMRGSGLELSWVMPLSAGYLFDVYRAEVSGEGADAAEGEFGRVASSLPLRQDGTLRYLDSGVEMGARYVYRMEASNDPGMSYTTGAIYVRVTRGSLNQNYPNPFNPSTRITFYVPDGQLHQVSLNVYDVKGARVKTLVNGVRRGGKYTVEWDGRNNLGERVASGVYFYRLVENNFTDTKKMLLLK